MALRRFFPHFLVLLLAIGAARQATAAYEYQYFFGQPNYLALPGQVIPVTVYLQETVSGGSTPWFTGPNVGLFGGGVRVFFDQPLVTTDRSEVLSTANITVNPLFTDPSKTLNVNPGISAGMIAAVNFPTDSLITGTPLSATSARILLGTFNFTAGLVNGEVTNLVATDFNSAQPSAIQNFAANSSTFATVNLDSLIVNGTATITVIPEPTALLGFAGFALAGWQIHRLRRKSSAS